MVGRLTWRGTVVRLTSVSSRAVAWKYFVGQGSGRTTLRLNWGIQQEGAASLHDIAAVVANKPSPATAAM